MLRLVAIGDADWDGVARRLRGAALDPAAPADTCDAAVLLDARDGTVERLLAAGKHVLLADEAALSPERLDAWAALARPGGPRLAVLNRDRHLPSRQLVRRQLDQNLGEPGLVRIHRWASAPSPALLARDLDLALWMLGRTPDVVHGLRTDGVLQVHLGFPGGGMALVAHAAGPHLAAGYSSLSVIASAGAAHADDHANSQLHFGGGAARAVRADEGVVALTSMVQSFVDALARGTDFPQDLAAWRAALAVRDAVGRSLAARQAVPLEGV